jgi:protein arginine kinase
LQIKKNELNNNNSIKASVVFSRIRLLRNFEKFYFTKVLDEKDKSVIENNVIDLVKSWNYKSEILYINKLDNNQKRIFSEENLIDKIYFINEKGRFVFFPSNNISLLINHKDHINMSIIKPNMALKNNYKLIEDVESKIGLEYNYAVSSKYGFLTTQIKNCGLGMKITVLLHLPGICNLNNQDKVFKLFLKRGYYITPADLEKKDKKYENYFYLSSRLNFGVSENDLVERFILGLKSLLEIENESINKHYLINKNEIVDNIFRSYGLLKYAKRMSFEEVLIHIANIRMGIKLNENIPVNVENLNKVYFKLKKGFINKIVKKEKIDKETAITKVVQSYLFMGEK